MVSKDEGAVSEEEAVEESDSIQQEMGSDANVSMSDRLGRMKLAPMFAGWFLIASGALFIFTEMSTEATWLVAVSLLLFVVFILKFAVLKIDEASGGMILNR